ncbi:unnamed protein product, partial [Rodentolepis nana]|uniref:C2 domain-containing protein n=1 Tax=Rodentolepis nana TaxID=102285 RepID=A0A158QHA4_RODNA
DDEGIVESSPNEDSTDAKDARHRFKRNSGDRRRYQRRHSSSADYVESKNRSYSGTDDSESISMTASDSEMQAGDCQRRQNRIRSSLADLFSRMKRTMSVPEVHEENSCKLWSCTLTIRSAELKEKINSCVHVYYMDKLISRTQFSGETISPTWDKKVAFPISNAESLLQLQIMEKHKIRADKLIGRAFIHLGRDGELCSHEAPIKCFNLRKRSTQILGTLYVDTIVEPGFLQYFDDSTIYDAQEGSEMPDEATSAITNKSYAKKHHVHNRLTQKLTSYVQRHNLHRSKKRSPKQGSKEHLYEPSIHSEDSFFFSPYETTRRYLEGEGATTEVNVPWHPFFDWPSNRSLQLPMMAFQRRYRTRFWELRIPKIPWPIEFLLPMTRLCFPTANLVERLDVGDTSKVTRIVESGFVNIYLIGARGLGSMPQVEMGPDVGMDGNCPSIFSSRTPAGSMIGDSASNSPDGMSTMGSGSLVSSPETRAASLVALHWAAKSLTLKPSPQIEFTYGSEKKSSEVVKNNSNPDFLEEFEFQVWNGSPGFVRVTVYDRETQAGTGGIPRSPIMGETVIDLNDMPLEVTQKMELQIMRNSNEARLLLFVTLTGLKTADRSPIQPRIPHTPSSNVSIPAPSLGSFDDASSITQDGNNEEDKKAEAPNLQPNLLQLVSDHFSYKKSFTNSQDIGWMRLKICSAMGLGGKSTNGRIEIFCVVDMFNTHLRTQSIIKRKNPTWNRCFVIPLSDIHGIMKITVVEVEKNKEEVIGGLAIHPLRVDNGRSKWYALKTPDFRGPAKGSILLEFNVFFNQLQQQRLEQVKPLLEFIRWFGRMLDDWWLWKNPFHTILSLIGYQLLVYFFQPFFIPLYMIITLLKNRIYNRESVESIIHRWKHNKNAVQLASPQEHEIYKHQYEMLEQRASKSIRLAERRAQGEDTMGLDSFNYGDGVTDTSKKLSTGSQSFIL